MKPVLLFTFLELSIAAPQIIDFFNNAVTVVELQTNIEKIYGYIKNKDGTSSEIVDTSLELTHSLIKLTTSVVNSVSSKSSSIKMLDGLADGNCFAHQASNLVFYSIKNQDNFSNLENFVVPLIAEGVLWSKIFVDMFVPQDSKGINDSTVVYSYLNAISQGLLKKANLENIAKTENACPSYEKQNSVLKNLGVSSNVACRGQYSASKGNCA
jgi:hypothetical protein